MSVESVGTASRCLSCEQRVDLMLLTDREDALQSLCACCVYQYEPERSSQEVRQGHWSAHQGCPLVHTAVVLGIEADEALQCSARRHQA